MINNIISLAIDFFYELHDLITTILLMMILHFRNIIIYDIVQQLAINHNTMLVLTERVLLKNNLHLIQGKGFQIFC